MFMSINLSVPVPRSGTLNYHVATLAYGRDMPRVWIWKKSLGTFRATMAIKCTNFVL